MSCATPRLLQLSRCLIAQQARGKPAPTSSSPAAFAICERLRPLLATLMGNAGFHTLLSRALAVAAPEIAWLRTVRVNAGGSLEWLVGAEAPPDAEEAVAGGGVLIAQLLGLLAAFIGENLTIRMIRETWPELSYDGLIFSVGDKK